MSRLPSRQIFLRGQRLSELTALEDRSLRRFHVCGGVSTEPPPEEGRRSGREEEVWHPMDRNALVRQAAGLDSERTTPRRVALVCDAGLGKTTNLQWLAYHLASTQGSRQVPFLLRLDCDADLEVLERQNVSGAVLERLVSEVIMAQEGHGAQGEEGIRQTLLRKLGRGQITLLIDGLDHGLSHRGLLHTLSRLLTSPQWARCPVWVSGRPYAFYRAHQLFFGALDWHFLRVEPLGEAEIRHYLTLQAGGDWYDDLEAGRELLAVPRLLRLLAGILRDAVCRLPEGATEERRARVRGLGLRTAADVYHLAYFTPGEYQDPHVQLPGPDLNDCRGLLASGLVGEAAYMGLADGEDPSELNYAERIQRTADLLGAIAFTMFATNEDSAHPEPNTAGVMEGELGDFRRRVSERLAAATGQPLGMDFERLIRMNNNTVDFLLFRELGQRGVAWHDRTVQAFFAACWAMRRGSAEDRALLRHWVVDNRGERLNGYDEFWTFAAELPDELVDAERWLGIFRSCYDPPQQVTGPHERVQWVRRMIYHTFPNMEERSPDTIAAWRGSFTALATGTPQQRRIHAEIVDGLQPIPAGICLFGADPSEDEPGTPIQVESFRMHQLPVTNEMYEAFHPGHQSERWDGHHPLFHNTPEEDRCPVVKVTWYDAWCFAAWCGCRLPTEQEWEHACRAGSPDRWFFGNDQAELRKYAWHYENSEKATHPVGTLLPNKWNLFDVHGNVWEWCVSHVSPMAPARVLRGGSWSNNGWICRSADRYWIRPEYRDQLDGFRLAAVPRRALEPSKAK